MHRRFADSRAIGGARRDVFVVIPSPTLDTVHPQSKLFALLWMYPSAGR
ncbi:MAG: hypothetical protein ABIT38_22240 [Gemmatimonadaceae bacterium]